MTTHGESARPPDRGDILRWAQRSRRALIGWSLVALAAVASFLAWYGVSGESITAKQVPYAVSGGLAGIVLVVVAAILLVSDDRRWQFGRLEEIERKVDDLYSLLVADEPMSTPDTSAATTGELVALPDGTTYHRAECRLVVGKPAATAVDAAAIGRRSLGPCPVCEPPAVDTTG